MLRVDNVNVNQMLLEDVVTAVQQALLVLVLLVVLLVIVTLSEHFLMHVTNNLGSVYAVSEELPVANVTNANLDFGISQNAVLANAMDMLLFVTSEPVLVLTVVTLPMGHIVNVVWMNIMETLDWVLAFLARLARALAVLALDTNMPILVILLHKIKPLFAIAVMDILANIVTNVKSTFGEIHEKLEDLVKNVIVTII